MQVLVKHFFISILIFSLCSCSFNQNEIPEGVLSEPEMTSILTELELTQAVIKLKANAQDSLSQEALFNADFERFNITQEEFNASLNYYSKSPKKLMNMYERVIENLSKQQPKSVSKKD